MERKYTTRLDDRLSIDVRGIPDRTSKTDSQVIGFDRFVRDFKSDSYFDTGVVNIDWTVDFVDKKNGYEIEHSIGRIRASLEFIEPGEDSDETFEMEMDIDSSNKEWTIEYDSDTIIKLGSFISPQSIEIDLLEKKIMVGF